jgi:hypothetical protein
MKTMTGRFIIRTSNGTILKTANAWGDAVSQAEKFYLQYRQEIQVFDNKFQKVRFTRSHKVLQEWT